MTADPFSMSVLLLRSVEQYWIGQAGHHLREARIVRRAVIDVPIDGLEPALDLASRDLAPRDLAQRRAAERPSGVNQKVHLGRRAVAGQTRYSGASIMAAIQPSRFCSRAAIDAA